jgi:hypothetical protein
MGEPHLNFDVYGAEDAPKDAILNDTDHDLKLTEIERLLNDPDSPIDPSRVWALLAEVSQQAAAEATDAAHP